MIGQILTLMEFWQISIEDLQKAGDVLPTKPAAAARYKHPTTAETWDGEGSQPEWLRRALLQEGYRVEELRL